MSQNERNRFFLLKLFDFLFRKIKTKVIIFELLLILFIAFSFGSVVTLKMEATLVDKAHQLCGQITRDLAKAIKFDSLPDSDDAVGNYSDVEGILYLGYEGMIYSGGTIQNVHLFIGELISGTSDTNLQKRFILNGATSENTTNENKLLSIINGILTAIDFRSARRVIEFQFDDKTEYGFEYYAPVTIRELDNRHIGAVTLRYAKSIIDREIHRTRILIGIITLVIILIALYISLKGANNIVNPIVRLTDLVKRFGEGDLEVKISLPYRDEIGMLADTFDDMVVSVREKLEMQKFVSSSTVKMIKESVGKKSSETQRKTVTLLFSDIRGFTSMSETMDAEEVVEMLNLVLDLQTRIIRENQGDIDKFVGDEVVAVFDTDGMCQYAVKSAREIQSEMAKLNKTRQKEGKNPVYVGIGINVGEVVVGSIGSHDRMDYTVIGDNVNLTARLCSYAKAGEIVISKNVYVRLPKKGGIKALDKITVKGKAKPVEVYNVGY
jgi:adenylate cyclase